MYLATVLPSNCLYVSGLGCTVHRIHRIISATIDEERIIGDIHAIALVASVPRYRSTMLDKLFIIVDEDLEVLDAGCPEWAEHADAVIEVTLGREFHYTRGSKTEGDVLPEDSALSKRMLHLKKFMNVDWRRPKLGHVETGCCASRVETVKNIVAAVSNSGMVEGLNSEEVSKNRWGCCSKHLCRQVSSRSSEQGVL